MAITVLNRKTAGPDELREAIYVGRPSPLQNPFVMGKDGDRQAVVEKFRAYFTERLLKRDPEIENAFRALKPTDRIVCFCDPEDCHGHVIRDLYQSLCCSGRPYEEALTSLLSTGGVESPVYRPATDGIDHINVYSKGKTKLGRLLTNFARTPFIHPIHGKFASVEGCWYWLAVSGNGRAYFPDEADELRALHGNDAKVAGKELLQRPELDYAYLVRSTEPTWSFMQNVKSALLAKVEQNEALRQMLKESTLPLVHYYVWGNNPANQKVSYPKKHDWVVNYLSDIRDYLNGKAHKLIIAGSRCYSEESDYKNLCDGIKLIDETLGLKVIEVVSGTAPGVDRHGERWASEHEIPVRRFPADWEKDKKAAGHIRNRKMAEYATAAVLQWDGISPGTAGMKQCMESLKKPCWLIDSF